MPRGTPGGALLLVLAMLAAAPAGAAVKLNTISRAENRVVFAGSRFDAYTEIHLHVPFKASHYAYEAHFAVWKAVNRRVPVFQLALGRLPPGRAFTGERRKSLEDDARGRKHVRGLPFASVSSGAAETALGPVEYLIFEAGDLRCGFFRQYLNEHRDPDRPDDMVLSGSYCPVSGEVDHAALAAVLARIGIRGIAVPSPPPGGDLAALVISGDLAGLRRWAAHGLDPNAAISFSHPRFAGGRTIRRPMIVAAALFGREATVAWLIGRGAALAGRGSGAICAAIAEGHEGIVELLLARNPALAGYDRCGRGGSFSARELARRLGREAIARRLEAGPR